MFGINSIIKRYYLQLYRVAAFRVHQKFWHRFIPLSMLGYEVEYYFNLPSPRVIGCLEEIRFSDVDLYDLLKEHLTSKCLVLHCYANKYDRIPGDHKDEDCEYRLRILFHRRADALKFKLAAPPIG